MSFLHELRIKKNILKPTNTVVKTPGGGVFLERKDEEGVLSLEQIGQSEGFVVDLKPDIQVASVLPGLFMGSQDVTHEDGLLQKYKVTNILSIGVQISAHPGFDYSFVEVLDIPEFDMKPIFERCCFIIDSVRDAGGSVFVHCNAGVSRSAAVVIAYLMTHQLLSYTDAYQLLKSVRPCIKPNEGFVRQLKSLEKRLK